MNIGDDQDERKMQLLSQLASLKVTFMLIKVLILYPNMQQQEENNSLAASNDRHRAETANIRRVVDWLEEQVKEKEGNTAEE